jgi:spore maturation protein CgeB
MNILFLGYNDESSTARHRADAWRRLGHEVTVACPHDAIEPYCKGRILNAIHYRTGYAMLRPVVRKWLMGVLAAQKRAFDLCWVDGGELLSFDTVQALRRQVPKVVLFNHDDPSGKRDGARFNTLRAAISAYDLCMVVRPFNVDEFKQLGARVVTRSYMSYDEARHAWTPQPGPVPPQFDNDVVFIGRNMNNEGRDDLMLHLVEQGIKPAIWGDNWQASRHWARLQPFWKGGSISGADYVNAMHHARICLGMLSKGNRDEHTTRSMEIPYAGGLLCAERTSEHLALYREGQEAVFWSSPPECAEQCKRLLADPALIERIKQAGRARVLANKVGNEDLCRSALNTLGLDVLT